MYRSSAVELVLRQWDRADDMGAAADGLRAERKGLRAELASAEANLNSRREAILASFTAEFQDTVTALGIPGVQTATIHPTNYLPLLNGRPFATFSRGGGIITAAQVAYWTPLLAVALRRGDTRYPALLIIDSPRLALNAAEDLSAALYRRLVTMADASPGQVQFLIADNQLPPTTAATRPRSTSPTTPPPSRLSATPARRTSTRSRWMNQTCDTGRP